MQEAPAEVQQMFHKLWLGLERDRLDREERNAKADPRAHKLSKVFANSAYRCVYAGRNGKNQSVWYCWSSHRNVAGYYLGWRETHMRSGTVRRDQWAARKSRKAVSRLARKRAERFGHVTPAPEEALTSC